MSLTPEDHAERIAKWVGFPAPWRDALSKEITAAIRAAVAEEREACALIAEQLRQDATTNHALYRDLEWVGIVDTAEGIRDTIRARSETPPAEKQAGGE